MELLQQDGSDWNTGSCMYYPDKQYDKHLLSVAIQFSLGEALPKMFGLLDTASRWVVFSKEFLHGLDIPINEETAPVEKMHTRFGLIQGIIDRLTIEVVAETGQPVSIDANCFISEHWSGPPVIGWKGCLERIRFALDPSKDRFYFGPY